MKHRIDWRESRNLILLIVFFMAVGAGIAAIIPAQTVTSYGKGCNSHAISMSLPKLGTTVIVDVQAAQGPGFLGVGQSRVFVPLGGTCYLLVDPASVIPFVVVDPTRTRVRLFRIPNSPWLRGVMFRLQASGWSNGLEGVIG